MATILRVTEQHIINDKGFSNPIWFFNSAKELDPVATPDVAIPACEHRKNWGWMGKCRIRFTLDLGGLCRIDKLMVGAAEADCAVRVKAGTPFAYDFEAEGTPEAGAWGEIAVGRDTRYLNLSFVYNQAPNAIVIYGERLEPECEYPEEPVRPHAKLTHYVGSNGFVNDMHDVNCAVSYIREYHTWNWTAKRGEDGLAVLAANPSANDGRWDFDEYYKRCHDDGISVIPTLQADNSGREFFGERHFCKPAERMDDTEDPNDYRLYASMVYQFAARYGSNKNVDPATIRVSENNEPLVGLGYLEGAEFLNEPDGWWMDRTAYFTPFELAAFLSACYDGHEGTMGVGFGAKQADPAFRVSMSGLATVEAFWIKAMHFWAKFNRKDGKLPFDIINLHHYCTKVVNTNDVVDANTAGRDMGDTVFMGVSPEEGNIVGEMAGSVKYRNTYCPDLEIWLTEFGWDTNQDYRTDMSAHAYGPYTPREVQAMWLLREYLVLSPYIDRAAMFMSRDCLPEDKAVGKFGSSGMVTNPIEVDSKHCIGGNKKDSYYHIFTLNRILRDCAFAEFVPSGNANVNIYRYVTDEGKSRYALWCHTSDNVRVPGLELAVTGEEYTLVTPAYNECLGVRTPLTVKDGKVTVDVSEQPVFVVEK